MRQLNQGQVAELKRLIAYDGDTAYFDQTFAARYATLTGCAERDALEAVRNLARSRMATTAYRHQRNQYGLAIRDAAEILTIAYATGDEFVVESAAKFLGCRDPWFAWAVFLRHEI